MSLTSSSLCCCLAKPWQWLKDVCGNSHKSTNPYLGECELQRVLALIGYLANCESGNGVKEAIVNEKLPFPSFGQDSTKSGWLQVANSHPEFFFVTGDTKSIKLWARFHQTEETDGNSERPSGARSRPPLEPDRILQLQETAMKLHDAAVSLSAHELERRSFWVSTVCGLFSGVLAALVTCWLKGN